MDAVCTNDCNTLKQLVPGPGRVGQQVLDMAMLTASREGFTQCARLLLVRRRTPNGLAHRVTFDAFVAPIFVTSTAFVTAIRLCQFISTTFVNLTTVVNFCQLRGRQFCQKYQTLMSLQTRSPLFVNKAWPLLSTVFYFLLSIYECYALSHSEVVSWLFGNVLSWC